MSLEAAKLGYEACLVISNSNAALSSNGSKWFSGVGYFKNFYQELTCLEAFSQRMNCRTRKGCMGRGGGEPPSF